LQNGGKRFSFGAFGMDAASASKSIAIMEAVLSGETYESVAASIGMTRTAVERRVKVLACELQLVVGVVGVDEYAVPTVALLRERRDSYLEALSHYHPGHAPWRRDTVLVVTDKDIDLLVERTQQTSSYAQRDVALLLVLFSTAAKPLEIARLDVRDYLNHDGSVRKESLLREEAAIGGKARPLFFQTARTNAAIDRYLEERLRRGHGVTTSHAYRGLQPYSRLFLTDEGGAMPIRLRQFGMQRHQVCGVILDTYRKLFARAGFRGLTAMTARRTVAHKLKERGLGNQDIGKLLGLKQRNSVRKLLYKPRQPLQVATRHLV
jgi:hypothetical protein